MTTKSHEKEYESRLDELRAELESKQAEIDSFEIDPDDYEDQYCEMIDEGGPVRIGSLEYTASYVLREIDPTAYRCGLLDYVDNIEIDYDPKYCELLGELHDIEDEIEYVQSELDEIRDAEE